MALADFARVRLLVEVEHAIRAQHTAGAGTGQTEEWQIGYSRGIAAALGAVAALVVEASDYERRGTREAGPA